MDTQQNIQDRKGLDRVLFYWNQIWKYTAHLLKWLTLAVITGLVVGVVSSVFAHALKAVTGFRMENLQVFLLLPIAGLCIVFLYQKFGKNDGGTNQVLAHSLPG